MNDNTKKQTKVKASQKKDDNILTALFNYIANDKNIVYFKNELNQLCATITENNKTTSCLIDSDNFRDYVHIVAHEQFDDFVMDSQIASICTRLNASLKNNQTLQKHTVYNRIGVSKKDFYYYNLDDRNFVTFNIDTSRKPKITTSTKAKFFTSDKQIEQVYPDLSCNFNNLIDLLSEHFRFGDYSDMVVFVSWLIYCFVPDSDKKRLDHPALILVGMQGSGKSTALEKISKIVSPCINPFESINSRENLLLNLASNYVSTFDNVRKISNDLQDILCKAVTGGTETMRTLFTTTKTTTISYKTILILNGISTGMATNSDFLDRCITLKLDKITPKERLTKDETMKAFEDDLPKILGCIFNLLPNILNSYSNIELTESPRFKDFAQFGTAVANILFYDDDFISAYNYSIYCTQTIAIEEDIVLETLGRLISMNDFKGSASDLITALKNFADENGVILPELRPNKLSAKINHAEGALKVAGISVDHQRSNGQRIIILTKQKSLYY